MRSLACGGLAGVFTKVTMLPLDLAKKRLEVSSDRMWFDYNYYVCKFGEEEGGIMGR